ncbi:MAG: hypothetical protein GIKADHBN_01537 [Phycisphaerales bacterium]|nr:hypothetical protein [Phycisphaerales bacterium]
MSSFSLTGTKYPSVGSTPQVAESSLRVMLRPDGR